MDVTTASRVRPRDALTHDLYPIVRPAQNWENGCAVMKFGGTSLADATCIRRAAARVADAVRAGRRVAVVVSAMGTTTDRLSELAATVARHRPARELDFLLSTGECVSAALMAMALHDLGCPATALTGGQAGIVTDDSFGVARVRRLHPDRLVDLLTAGTVAVVTGFQGVTESQEITTLGRGGSDASAVLLAAMLGAPVCDIFTDVDGVHTADPRQVPDADLIPSLSYPQMQAMARAGAQVVQERAVEIAAATGVLLHVRSSFHSNPGTLVGPPDPPHRPAVALPDDETAGAA